MDNVNIPVAVPINTNESNKSLYLLVGSSEISLNMSWHIYKGIIVISGIPNTVEISHKVISLLHELERSEEAVGCSGSISLRIFLEGYDPAIEEGDDVIPVKGLAFEVHPLLGLVIFLCFLGEAVEGRHHVVEADRLGVRDHLVGMSATSLIDNCLVVEFLRDWVNKTSETSTVLTLHLVADVAD